MNIIFGRKNAQELSPKFLVLELETLDAQGTPLECFCLVPGEAISQQDMPTLAHYTKLHQSFVESLNNKNYSVCHELATHLRGQFGGELDSFYEVILKRISTLV